MNEFNSKILYDQTCITEEGVNVLSTIYAVIWTYPGAMTSTSARIRLTCVYSYDKSIMSIHGGTIEKWRNEGWSLIDEYHDDRADFYTPHEFRDRLFKHTQSFLTGVVLTEIDHDYIPTDFTMPPASPSSSDNKKKHCFKVLEYDKKKSNPSKKKKTDKTKLKDTDFDWV